MAAKRATPELKADMDLPTVIATTDKQFRILHECLDEARLEIQGIAATQAAVRSALEEEIERSDEWRRQSLTNQELMMRAFRIDPLVDPGSTPSIPKARLSLTLTPWETVKGIATIGGIYLLVLKVAPLLPAFNQALLGK